MGFGVKTNLGNLIFGHLNISHEEIIRRTTTSQGFDVSVDEIATLGTDLLSLIGTTTQDRFYIDVPLTGFSAYLQMYTSTSGPNYGYTFWGTDNNQKPPETYSASTLKGAGGIVATKGAYLVYSKSALLPGGIWGIIHYGVNSLGQPIYRASFYNPNLDGPDEFYICYDILHSLDTYTPYEPPQEGGGLGAGDTSSDPVDFPDLPLVSALGTGTVNMYRATQLSLRDFSQYLWQGDFVDNVKKLFQDPMEAVISVQLVPYQPEQSEAETDVYLSWLNTGVKMYPLTNQYLEIKCGTLQVSEFWGSYLDYPPSTEISIFLPYIGLKSLSVQDVMARTIELRYHIDCLTGTCLAMLKCSGNGLNSVMYEWAGNCNMQIPIAARDFSSIYSGAINLVATAGIAAATGTKAAGRALLAAASVQNTLNLDTHVRQAGSIGGSSSYFGVQTPYLVITRPIDSTPTDFNEQTGRPSNLTGNVGDFSGFLQASYCHIENLIATEEEKNMVDSFLKSGIFL